MDQQIVRVDDRMSDDDFEVVFGWISGESDWGRHIPRKTFRRACDHGLCAIARVEDRPIGFTRAVTDYATFAWICDVFVEERFRGLGAARALMAWFRAHPELQGLRRWCLSTRTAWGLYEKFGFGPVPVDQWMMIKDETVYLRANGRDDVR